MEEETRDGTIAEIGHSSTRTRKASGHCAPNWTIHLKWCASIDRLAVHRSRHCSCRAPCGAIFLCRKVTPTDERKRPEGEQEATQRGLEPPTLRPARNSSRGISRTPKLPLMLHLESQTTDALSIQPLGQVGAARRAAIIHHKGGHIWSLWGPV